MYVHRFSDDMLSDLWVLLKKSIQPVFFHLWLTILFRRSAPPRLPEKVMLHQYIPLPAGGDHMCLTVEPHPPSSLSTNNSHPRSAFNEHKSPPSPPPSPPLLLIRCAVVGPWGFNEGEKKKKQCRAVCFLVVVFPILFSVDLRAVERRQTLRVVSISQA